MVGAYQQSGSCAGELCRYSSLELNSVTCRKQEQTTRGKHQFEDLHTCKHHTGGDGTLIGACMGGRRGVRLINTDNQSVHYHLNRLREGDSETGGSIRLLEPKEKMGEGRVENRGRSYREARVGGSSLRDAISAPTSSLPRSKTRWTHGSRPVVSRRR